MQQNKPFTNPSERGIQFLYRLFYHFRPFIPRALQIAVRRQIVSRKRKMLSHVWPINEASGKAPDGWMGWPHQKQFALVLSHDVDTAIGYKKCIRLMELEKSFGFRSSFNFVPERYHVSPAIRHTLVKNGFEVAVHGLRHDGKLYFSRKEFSRRAVRINHYLKEWGSVGFNSPSMHHNLEWHHDLDIEYSQSTFDTDPFEPQADGPGTIFPFWVHGSSTHNGFVELPYTLPQDFTLFILMMEKDTEIWQRKLDWIIERGGIALLNTHPDYMNFDGNNVSLEEYPSEYYRAFLDYIRKKYAGQYWHVLPRQLARFWSRRNANSA